MKTEIESHVLALLLGGVSTRTTSDGNPVAMPTHREAKRLWKKVGERLTTEFIKDSPGCQAVGVVALEPAGNASQPGF